MGPKYSTIAMAMLARGIEIFYSSDDKISLVGSKYTPILKAKLVLWDRNIPQYLRQS